MPWPSTCTLDSTSPQHISCFTSTAESDACSGWRLANIHTDRGLCPGHGAVQAEVALPLCASLPGPGGSPRADSQLLPAALPLVQGELSRTLNIGLFVISTNGACWMHIWLVVHVGVPDNCTAVMAYLDLPQGSASDLACTWQQACSRQQDAAAATARSNAVVWQRCMNYRLLIIF